MSGIVALLHGDGRPVEDSLIGRLTEAMRYRGPDGAVTARAAGMAMGCARHETLAAPTQSRQPLLFDDRLRLVADARLDDRASLVADLAARGRPVDEAASDEAILAHAYDQWGPSCVERLLGDFCFLIWDSAERTLFGARDHVGVKPLYYIALGNDLLTGNTLAGLLCHPGVSDGLDELAIADFLLFGTNRHPERTSFAAIRRVPPAHTLQWRPGGAPRLRRYWRLAVDEPLKLRAQRDYLERFEELLRRAVADRLRGGQTVVMMSGGLDSTSVAAMAREVVCQRDDDELVAVTYSLERLMEDEEPAFAVMVADHLRVPQRTVVLHDDRPSELWGPSATWTAEPLEMPASSRNAARCASAMEGARVALTGQGGDPLLHLSPGDAAYRARKDGAVRTGWHILRYATARGHLPRSGLRTWLRHRSRGRGRELPPFPPWLRPDLVDRLGLRDRYRTGSSTPVDERAYRPEAAGQLGGPEWSFALQEYDAGSSYFPVEYRHPFLDVRVIEFLLSLPVMPWLVEKDIVRRAMRDRLPAAVLARRKTPLPVDPVHRALLAGAADLRDLASDVEDLAQFVDVARFRSLATRPQRLHAWETPLVTRPLGLAFWMKRVRSSQSPLVA